MIEAGKPKFAGRFKARIAKHFSIRIHMSLILMSVIGSGILLSKLMLGLGLRSVGLRYPLAVLGSYAVFLGMMRMWIWYVLPSLRRSSRWIPDVGNLGSGWGGGGPHVEGMHFGGGSSGGGGATGSWGSGSSGGSSGGGGGGDVGDAIWIVIAVVVVVAVIAGAGVYLVWIAPELMPDLALQVLLTSGMAKTAKTAAQHDWMGSVFKKTWIPLGLVLIVVSGLGFVVHHTCPTAVKLTQAFTCPPSPRR